jgi:hypothetical protein
MGRPAKLAVGALLLGLSAFLFAIRDQAADADTATVVIAIFAVPGSILFFLGILPGRELSEHTKMVFSPTRLMAGIGWAALGVAVVYANRFLHLPSPVLVLGMFLVPAGLLYSGSCWAQGCRNCGVLLSELRAQFDSSITEMLEAAVLASGVGEILSLHRRVPGPRRTMLLVRYCPRCLGAGLLTGPRGARSGLRPDQVKPLLAGLVEAQ